MYDIANPFPVRSFILFAWIINVYVTPFARFFLGFMLSMLPVMVLVNDIAFPLEFLSSIHEFALNLIALLNLILITLFLGTFTAFLTGFVLITFGEIFTTVLNCVIYCVNKPFPARSVTLLGFNVSLYNVLVARSWVVW